jgi:cysteine-rich repeat protein
MKKRVIFGLLGATLFACKEGPTEPACGNNVIEVGEQCEPPNSAVCDAICLVINPGCGDGVLAGTEVCDDGNVNNGDGCRSNCTAEACGDGIPDPGEQCDDGNVTSGDGCSSTCTLENNNAVCGNNQQETGETCDDGNTAPGDGCNTQCQIEAGGNCGNGDREVGEECDDGNTGGGDGCDGQCRVEPPAGQSADQVETFHIINAIRASVGLPGQQLNAQLDQAAQAHAAYHGLNGDNTGNPHTEASGSPGFTGVNFFDRTSAAGFNGQSFFEVMAFFNSPQPAVDIWLNSVFHRVPLIHPNATQMGYGGAGGAGGSADVIDFGLGASEDPTQIVLFPPPNATGVTRSFNTFQEGPTPPAAPGGNSTTGPIVSVLSDFDIVLTESKIFDSSGVELPTTLVSPQTPGLGPFMSGTFAFYAAGPAPANATFTAHIAGTINGQAFTRDWSFTTE